MSCVVKCWWSASSQSWIEFKFISVLSSFTVQGSHRDSTKQNKDLAMLTQHSSSNNLNNPSSLSANKNAASATDVDRSGPYFDVAASKNVRNTIIMKFYLPLPFTPLKLCEGFSVFFGMNYINILPQVTALLGKTAYLNCRVKNLGNKTVSIQCHSQGLQQWKTFHMYEEKHKKKQFSYLLLFNFYFCHFSIIYAHTLFILHSREIESGGKKTYSTSSYGEGTHWIV